MINNKNTIFYSILTPSPFSTDSTWSKSRLDSPEEDRKLILNREHWKTKKEDDNIAIAIASWVEVYVCTYIFIYVFIYSIWRRKIYEIKKNKNKKSIQENRTGEDKESEEKNETE